MLRDASAPADADANLQLRFENTVNTPILSVTWLGNGQAVAGQYDLEVVAGPAVDITCAHAKNPWQDTGVSITADDATVCKDVIPGVGIVFSSSAAAGWEGRITVGAYMNSSATVADRLNVGIVEAGDTSTQRRIAAVNVGDQDSAETEVYSLPGFYLDGASVEDFVSALKCHSDPTRHDIATAGDYTITFSGYAAGPPQTVDVLVDAVKTIEDGEMDGSTLYEHGQTGYIDVVDGFEGLGIVFANAPGDPSALSWTLYVRNGHELVEFAPDVAGSPGAWTSGPLTLTESGESSGVITPSGVAYFWVRTNLPGGETPGDLRLFNIRARGLTI